MKDRFFDRCRRAFQWIYRMVTWVIYTALTRRLTAGLQDLTSGQKREIRTYWKKFGVRVPLAEYRWYAAKGVEPDPRRIPSVIWHSRVEPWAGDLGAMDAFADKNYLDLLIGKENTPETLCRCISGQLLDRDYEQQSPEALCTALQREKMLICKPAIQSGGGRNICFFSGNEAEPGLLFKLRKTYGGNFVIQRLISQHAFFAAMNPECLNTMRIITFLFEGQVHVLSALLRIGRPGSRVDNTSSGGIWAGMTRDGSILDRVYSTDLKTHDIQIEEALSAEMNLGGRAVPCWQQVVELLTQSHLRLSHFKIIYWDVAVREDGSPVVVECNLMDSSICDNQVFGGPIFGDLTERVLSQVFEAEKDEEGKYR